MKNESLLKFNRYEVIEFDFKTNENYIKQDKNPVDIKFAFSDEKSGENNFKIKITVYLNNEKFKDDGKQFYLKATLVGHFTFIGYDPNNDTHLAIIKQNTAAILFPYIRSLISHITLEAQIDPVLLPTLNLINYFKDQEKPNAPQNQN